MFGYIHEMAAVSFSGVSTEYFGSLTHSIPLPILILTLAVVVIVMHGAFSRFRTMTEGETAGTDFIGLMVVLVMLVLLAVLLGSGVVKGIKIL